MCRRHCVIEWMSHPGLIPSHVLLPCRRSLARASTDSQVRETISIREQQAALIAQRRAEAHISTPPTPRELTFKGWMPKQPQPSVGRRRDKTREKVERMSIVTSGDKDVMPGSKVG